MRGHKHGNKHTNTQQHNQMKHNQKEQNLNENHNTHTKHNHKNTNGNSDMQIQHGQKHHGLDENSHKNSDFFASKLESQDFSTDLKEEDINKLVHLYQDEKLALDVYSKLADTYDSKQFENISNAEARHLATVEKVLEDNNIDISALQNLNEGEFLDSNMQDLYNSLIEKGLTSYQDALEVGVTIEETDIADLSEYISDTTDTILVGVYDRLNNGSEHHLNAFDSALM